MSHSLIAFLKKYIREKGIQKKYTKGNQVKKKSLAKIWILEENTQKSFKGFFNAKIQIFI